MNEESDRKSEIKRMKIQEDENCLVVATLKKVR